MSEDPSKLVRFWKEFRRRKVIPFLIGYIAACFAIIEFFLNTADRYSIPDSTLDLIYILAAAGLPIVIILPWIINRKKPETAFEEPSTEAKSQTKEPEEARHNLPAQLTTFIGREKEMQVVKDLINKHRLVTLTGAGGCGKTRLAIEVANQIVPDIKDGVWFVDLAAISNEDQVIKEIAEVLAIAEIPNQSLLDTLIEGIKNKELVIILDNCEHLVKACAEISGKLVQSVPKLKILATSRESLSVTGEQVWRVPSLTLLDPKDILGIESVESSEAVLLFQDRARLSNPEFELELDNITEVVTICNKVDGIPLALELVASRTKHMDPKLILERFTDRFDQLSSSDPGISKRQKTLQATIDWSYNLLTDSEKLLFTRLSVFSGGFDLVAAEEVCSDDRLPKESILEALSRLVDRSLIYTVKAENQALRYYTLQTLKQFAQQILKEIDEEVQIRKRHLQYYIDLANEAYLEQYEDQLKWLNKLDTEEDNLIATLEWSQDHSPVEFSWLAGALAWYWIVKSKYYLVKNYLERAVSVEIRNPAVKARVLYGYGLALAYFNEIDKTLSLFEESLTIWRKLNNPQEEANVLSAMGQLQRDRIRDFEIGYKYCNQALELAQKLGKPGLENHCLTGVCQTLVHSKQYEKGLPYAEQLIESSEKLEQPNGIIAARHFHSDCALGMKDYKEAEKRYSLGIETAMKYGNDWLAFVDLQGVAFALSGQKRWPKTLRLNAASVEKARSVGVTIYGMLEFWDEWIDTYIEGAKKEVGEELAKQYEEEGIAMGFEKAVEYALDFKKD